MFSKFLRRISVAVIGVIFLLGAFSGMSLCAKAQSPGTGELEVFHIEQVRAEMPQIQVYVRGVNANEACEAYLDGNALTSTGNQSLDENGTSYLIMLDISGSITSEYFLAAKKQVEELAQNLGPVSYTHLDVYKRQGSHRAARRQKYHYSVMALSYGEAVIHLPSTYRSFPQWEIIAFVTDVAHHHRNVTEECVFSFQGPLPDVAWLAYSITAQIVKCVGLVDLLGKPDRSTFGMIFQF